jgi:hypothetical protein
MTKRVLKGTVEIGSIAKVVMPREAPILHVAAQNQAGNVVSFWWEQDDDFRPDHDGHERQFAAVGTGHEIEDVCEYRGTTMFLDGRFVTHLYELPSGLL